MNKFTTAKVSIIVPIYNTAKYLDECIQTIINQSLNEIEILLVVDETSKDNSVEICENYKIKDSRIKVFFDHHQGLSIARNIGIQEATGDYLCFQDSDDTFKLEALEKSYIKAIENNLDMVLFDADSFLDDNQDKIIRDYCLARTIGEGIFNGLDFFAYQIDHNLITVGPCYLVKKSILTDNKILFYPNIIHEDNLFTPQLYIASQRVGIIPEAFINRRVRDNSVVTSSISWANIEGYITGYSELVKQTKKSSNKEKNIIYKYIRATLPAVNYKARFLPINQRVHYLAIVLRNYLRFTTAISTLKILVPKYE